MLLIRLFLAVSVAQSASLAVVSSRVVHGRVIVDSTGLPLPNARVELRHGSEVRDDALTDDDGRFEVRVNEWSAQAHRLHVRKQLFVPAVVHAAASVLDSELVVRLVPRPRLRARLEGNAQGGTIFLWPTGELARPIDPLSTELSRDGSFEVVSWPGTPYDLLLVNPVVSGRMQRGIIALGTLPDEILSPAGISDHVYPNYIAAQGYTVSGTVKAGPDRVAVGRAALTVVDARFPSIPLWRQLLPPDGTFQISHVLPGDYALLVTAGDARARVFGRQSVHVTGSDVVDLAITVAPGATVEIGIAPDQRRGKGVCLGTPEALLRIQEAWSSIAPARGTALRDRVRWTGLPPSDYYLSASVGSDSAIRCESAPLKIDVRQRLSASITPRVPVTVSGRLLVDAERAVVTLTDVSGGAYDVIHAMHLRADETFKFSDLFPGLYRLGVSRVGEALNAGRAEKPGSYRLPVTGSQDVVVDITMRPQ